MLVSLVGDPSWIWSPALVSPMGCGQGWVVNSLISSGHSFLRLGDRYWSCQWVILRRSCPRCWLHLWVPFLMLPVLLELTFMFPCRPASARFLLQLDNKHPWSQDSSLQSGGILQAHFQHINLRHCIFPMFMEDLRPANCQISRGHFTWLLFSYISHAVSPLFRYSTEQGWVFSPFLPYTASAFSLSPSLHPPLPPSPCPSCLWSQCQCSEVLCLWCGPNHFSHSEAGSSSDPPISLRQTLTPTTPSWSALNGFLFYFTIALRSFGCLWPLLIAVIQLSQPLPRDCSWLCVICHCPTK